MCFVVGWMYLKYGNECFDIVWIYGNFLENKDFLIFGKYFLKRVLVREVKLDL